MPYRLLITDVDGTLVDHQQRILPRNLEAIARFKRAGGLAVLGTGRIEASARPIALAMGANAPSILYNGGRVVNLANGHVLFQALVPAPITAILTDLFASAYIERVHPILYSEGKPYVRQLDTELKRYALKDRLTLEVAGDLRAFVDRPVSKFLIIGADADLLALDADLKAAATAAGLPVTTVRSEPTYLEVLPPGCSKGTALVRLAEALGIPISQVVAVGDNLNDLEMIRMAGLGVAVANAHPDLKAAADFVSPYTNEEAAVADVIERFCLEAIR